MTLAWNQKIIQLYGSDVYLSYVKSLPIISLTASSLGPFAGCEDTSSKAFSSVSRLPPTLLRAMSNICSTISWNVWCTNNQIEAFNSYRFELLSLRRKWVHLPNFKVTVAIFFISRLEFLPIGFNKHFNRLLRNKRTNMFICVMLGIRDS